MRLLQRYELVTAARTVPERVLYFAELWIGGLFLQREAYQYLTQRRQPLASGMLFVGIVGVLVALANILGALARYATSPSPDAIKNTVLVHLQAMPFYEQMLPVTQSLFERGFNQTWELLGQFFVGYPSTQQEFAQLFVTLLTTPLGMIVTWLVYSALVHLGARKNNPETTFAQVAGALSLTQAPFLINVLNIFPGVSVNFWVLYLWFFVCAITGIRVAYNTNQAKAVSGALFPIIIGLVVGILLILLGVLVFLTRGGQ